MKEVTVLDIALTDQETARDYLRLESSPDTDNAIDRAINHASAYLERETRRALKSREQTFRVDGTGSNVVLLPEYPPTNVATVKIIDDDGVKTSLDLTGMFWHGSGEVVLPNDRFVIGRLNHEVVATCGYVAGTHASELTVLEFACLRLVQIFYQDWFDKTGRAEGIRVLGTGVSISTDKMPKEVLDVIKQFRRLA